jgi:hypothetical protein
MGEAQLKTREVGVVSMKPTRCPGERVDDLERLSARA